MAVFASLKPAASFTWGHRPETLSSEQIDRDLLRNHAAEIAESGTGLR